MRPSVWTHWPQEWPRTLLYTFPPVALIQTTLERVCLGDHKDRDAAEQEPLVSHCAQRPAVSGTWTNMTPTPRNLGPVGLAPEREKLMATGLQGIPGHNAISPYRCVVRNVLIERKLGVMNMTNVP